MRTKKGIFQRTELLFGKEKMDEIAGKKVIILGIGGVGSWCAESLIRSGIHFLTIVDSDRVCITNINRQLHATMNTVGEVKTEALKKRLLEINPFPGAYQNEKVRPSGERGVESAPRQVGATVGKSPLNDLTMNHESQICSPLSPHLCARPLRFRPRHRLHLPGPAEQRWQRRQRLPRFPVQAL